jgi:drug/metabolite transporter (DMT)-like permease
MSLAPAPVPRVADPAAAPVGPLSSGALLTLLALAWVFGANHVAARVAFDHGVDVATAVAVRSLGTAVVVALIVQAVRLAPGPRRWLLGLAALIALQSLALYAAVARLPVALALLAFNSFPVWVALWSWALFRQAPPRAVLWAMPVILLGLALALDAPNAVARAREAGFVAGIALAFVAAASFGLALVLTQQRVAAVDGRVRTALTMALVGAVALVLALAQGGLRWPTGPDAALGWLGLVLLTLFYGTGFTVMFVLLPKLGVAGNSPILNTEPVAALIMAWLLLGQTIAPMQLLGCAVVVTAVLSLGLRR